MDHISFTNLVAASLMPLLLKRCVAPCAEWCCQTTVVLKFARHRRLSRKKGTVGKVMAEMSNGHGRIVRSTRPSAARFSHTASHSK